MGRRPFKRGRFAELPEEPHRPHLFYKTTPIDLKLDSEGFGPMKVHVRKYGKGPPLLLVHGLMTSSYSWRYVYGPLGEHYTCYAPDLPSNGRSDRPLEPAYTPRVLARWIGQVQEALGIRGCRVIGNSMGGFLAMVLALDDPDAMHSLINLHSPGVPELRLHALKAGLAAPGVRRALRWYIRRKPQRWAFTNVHYYDETLKSLEEAREYGDLLGSHEGAQGLIKYLAETMDIAEIVSFQDRLKARRAKAQEFPVPLLLMYAKQDPMVPPRFGSALAARIPDATLVWLEEASHFAHVDAPERFLPPALDFLAKV